MCCVFIYLFFYNERQSLTLLVWLVLICSSIIFARYTVLMTFQTFCDWSRKLAPTSRPIRRKTKTNRTCVTRVSRASGIFFCFSFAFSRAPCGSFFFLFDCGDHFELVSRHLMEMHSNQWAFHFVSFSPFHIFSLLSVSEKNWEKNNKLKLSSTIFLLKYMNI